MDQGRRIECLCMDQGREDRVSVYGPGGYNLIHQAGSYRLEDTV